ncbi:FemAB family XrtA/PEP-CTERM system-associated protein [Sediminicurvatus halobius]|uniref:FemAB family XrtA/PEP-CTERM system-associated protein n=1 Tax=Sediminicurvatus halobius TaxID=2182432 RepID=UPI001E347926|nr:FemAB family XrtA/PEP-CTERM system-associated protein [Spiribacter halobius]UEX77355.1 FemAB family PEP-CTERM system-associated protein [Spiribacter halobius]
MGGASRGDSSHGLQVTTLTESDHPRWDAFVDACPTATFCHRAGWQTVIERAFRHPTWFLMAEGEQGIEGVLPLARVRSRLFGDQLTSLPFCVYGGIAATTDRATQALDQAAVDLAEDLGVGHLEYRHRDFALHDDWPTKDLYVTFRGAIHEDPDANLKAIPRKQRAMVRKGIDAGLEWSLDDDSARFFPAYAESVRNLGTPVFAKRYFDILRDVFGDACEVLTVTHRGRIVASVLSFYFRDEVFPYYGGGTGASRGLYANDFMYWSLMERARQRGCRVFDYGRSKKDTGSYRFKKHWGFIPEPLHYECRLVREHALRDNSPMNPRYQRFIRLWQRLPLPVANAIGPHIVRSLG